MSAPTNLVSKTEDAKTSSQVPYPARAFVPAHGDLSGSAGVEAQIANDKYVAALARIVYYWAYPAIDVMARTGQWETMKDGPGVMLGIFPAGPVNTTCLSDYMAPSQRMVVTPNNDTIYMSSFVDLGREPAVIQTPTKVPKGHYWTIQVADVFTNVIYQLGSAAGTPGGKYLLVGPNWNGEAPPSSQTFYECRRTSGGFPGAALLRTRPDPRLNRWPCSARCVSTPSAKTSPGSKLWIARPWRVMRGFQRA